MTAVLPGDDHGDMGDSMLKGDPTAPPARKGLFQSCEWFKQRPLSRWQFAVFLLFGVATLLWIVIKATSGITGDVLSGLCAVVLAGWGAQHFKILLGIKENVERLAKNNREFKQQNAAMTHQVDKLMKAQRELTATHDALTETTDEYKANISKFKQLDEKLNSLADDSIEGLGALKEMSKTVQESIQKELVQHEREILLSVQEAMELRDDQEGLTENEFNQFVNALPANFQERFSTMSERGKSFKEMAGDDGVLDLDEFSEICDEFAKEVVAGGGAAKK